MARTIRRKKPWAVVAAAGLLGVLSLSAMGNARSFNSVSETRFGDAEKVVADLQSEVGTNTSTYSTAKSRNKQIVDDGLLLVDGLERRERWLEVYRAINECLPRDRGEDKDEEDITKKNRMKLTSITAKKEADLKTWFSTISQNQQALETLSPADRETEPEGEGYVFTLSGVHYRNDDSPDFNSVYFIEEHFLADLKSWEVDNEGKGELVPVRKLGITHPVVAQYDEGPYRYDPNRKSDLASRAAQGGVVGGGGTGGTGGYPGGGLMGGTGGLMGGTGGLMGGAGGLMGGASGFGGGYPGGGGDAEEEGDIEGSAGGYAASGGGYPGTGGMGRGGFPGTGYPGGGVAGQANADDKNVLGLEGIDPTRKEVREIKQTRFLVQFAWKPIPKAERTDPPPPEESKDGDGGATANP